LGREDPNVAEEIVDEDGRVAAIVLVHIYGQPTDMGAILDLAERFGWW